MSKKIKNNKVVDTEYEVVDEPNNSDEESKPLSALAFGIAMALMMLCVKWLRGDISF